MKTLLLLFLSVTFNQVTALRLTCCPTKVPELSNEVCTKCIKEAVMQQMMGVQQNVMQQKIGVQQNATFKSSSSVNNIQQPTYTPPTPEKLQKEEEDLVKKEEQLVKKRDELLKVKEKEADEALKAEALQCETTTILRANMQKASKIEEITQHLHQVEAQKTTIERSIYQTEESKRVHEEEAKKYHILGNKVLQQGCRLNQVAEQLRVEVMRREGNLELARREREAAILENDIIRQENNNIQKNQETVKNARGMMGMQEAQARMIEAQNMSYQNSSSFQQNTATTSQSQNSSQPNSSVASAQPSYGTQMQNFLPSQSKPPSQDMNQKPSMDALQQRQQPQTQIAPQQPSNVSNKNPAATNQTFSSPTQATAPAAPSEFKCPYK